eukprot:TRINITY_DN25255_c0_g1_i1.p1 TRINITY_DN25255_c0_g1~~TRINITY_DN25255_c0_g1_i1.p1  ORF type:complete len:362 (-),score=113.78 TRINITY_DN25255_c0_g1_i1:603-1688(-)
MDRSLAAAAFAARGAFHPAPVGLLSRHSCVSGFATSSNSRKIIMEAVPSADERKARAAEAFGSAASTYLGDSQWKAPMTPMYARAAELVTKVVAEQQSTSGGGDSASADDKSQWTPTILDIAAASGEPSVTLAKLMPRAKIIATDYSAGMIEAMRVRVAKLRDTDGIANVHVDVADGENLSQFEDNSMDIVTCTLGLMFMPNWQKAIAEAYRVLKPNGLYLATVWGPKEEMDYYSLTRGVIDAIAPGYKMPVDPCCLAGGDPPGQDVVDAFETAGFVQVESSTLDITFAVPSMDAGWDQYFMGTLFKGCLKEMQAKDDKVTEAGAKAVYEDLLKAKDGWIAADGSIRFPHNLALMFTGRKH